LITALIALFTFCHVMASFLSVTPGGAGWIDRGQGAMPPARSSRQHLLPSPVVWHRRGMDPPDCHAAHGG
jgi:hypothetical protein